MGEIINIINSSNLQIAEIQAKPNYTKLEEVYNEKKYFYEVKDLERLVQQIVYEASSNNINNIHNFSYILKFIGMGDC